MTASVVSVIIPTFDRAEVIGQAIDSVLAQTHLGVQVIVVDDGSTDGTQAVIAARYAGDPRVQYRYQPNAGVAVARNAGLDLALGDYVAFLDSDDCWRPWHLSLMLAGLALYPDAGMIWTDIEAVDADGSVVGTSYLAKLLSAYRYFAREDLFATSSPLSESGIAFPPRYRDRRFYMGDVFSPMVMGNLVVTSSVVMRRDRVELVGHFDERFVTGEDYEFFLRACKAGPVAFADIDDIRYRLGASDQLSGRAMGLPMAKGYLKVLEATVSQDAARITLPPSMIDQARSYAFAWVGEQYLLEGSRRLARAHLAAALRIHLFEPRVWALLSLTFMPRALTVRLVQWRRG